MDYERHPDEYLAYPEQLQSGIAPSSAFASSSTSADHFSDSFITSTVRPRSRAPSSASSARYGAFPATTTTTTSFDPSPLPPPPSTLEPTSLPHTPPNLLSAGLAPGYDGESLTVVVPEFGQFRVSWEEWARVLLLRRVAPPPPALQPQMDDLDPFSASPTSPADAHFLHDDLNQLGLGQSPVYPSFQPQEESVYIPIHDMRRTRRDPPPPIETGFVQAAQQFLSRQEELGRGQLAAFPAYGEQQPYQHVDISYLPTRHTPNEAWPGGQNTLSFPRAAPDFPPSTSYYLPADIPATRARSLAEPYHLRKRGDTTAPQSRRSSVARTASSSSILSAGSSRPQSRHGQSQPRSRAASVASTASSSSHASAGSASSSSAVQADSPFSFHPPDASQPPPPPPPAPKLAKRELRPLNGRSETYIWRPDLGALSGVSDWKDPEEALEAAREKEEGAELITFPVGSYYVVRDESDLVIQLVDGSAARINQWLAGQRCIEGCKFNFERNVRPSVIRQHFVKCIARKKRPGPDPLARLCELQIKANEPKNARLADAAAATRARKEREKNHHRPALSLDTGFLASSSADLQVYPAAVDDPSGVAPDLLTSSTDLSSSDWAGYLSPSSVSFPVRSLGSRSSTKGNASSSSRARKRSNASTRSGDIPVFEDTWLASYGLALPSGSSSSSSSSTSSTAPPSPHLLDSSLAAALDVQMEPASGAGTGSFLSFGAEGEGERV
ncbi:hypothetical protein JCM8097_004658 [Rhodosporidiobolus ruineniae]